MFAEQDAHMARNLERPWNGLNFNFTGRGRFWKTGFQSSERSQGPRSILTNASVRDLFDKKGDNEMSYQRIRFECIFGISIPLDYSYRLIDHAQRRRLAIDSARIFRKSTESLAIPKPAATTSSKRVESSCAAIVQLWKVDLLCRAAPGKGTDPRTVVWKGLDGGARFPSAQPRAFKTVRTERASAVTALGARDNSMSTTGRRGELIHLELKTRSLLRFPIASHAPTTEPKEQLHLRSQQEV